MLQPIILNSMRFAEFFQGFDPFFGGLLGSFYLFLIVFLFSYLGGRGVSEKPVMLASEIAIATYGTGFFLHIISPHPFITGILVVLAFVVIIKLRSGLKYSSALVLGLYFSAVFSILSVVEPWIRSILLIFAILMAYMRGNLRIWDKKPEEKGKEEGKESKE